MANIIIGFPNRIDDATVTGGDWLTAMPIGNIKDRLLSRVARSADEDPASTTFTLDFGRQRNIRIIALIAHTISFGGRLRVLAANNSGFSPTVYDVTGDVWPGLTGGEWDIDTLEWEADNYWFGTYTQEETEDQTAVSSRVLPAVVQARYWRFDILDEGNAAGFVDIGRVFIGDGFLQPTVNYDYGASLGYETATGVETSLGGVKFFDPRESIRVLRFELSRLSEAESFTQALELTRRAGVHREVFVIDDPDDETYSHQRNFVGHLRMLNPLERALFQYDSMAFEIEELR